MKQIPLLLLFALHVSCAKEIEISSDKLVERQGLKYEINSTTPFSGATVYYQDGQLQIRCSYKDGEKNGPLDIYYDNGQLSTKGSYKDGELDGLWEWYDKNGQLRLKRTYKDGERDKF